MIIEDVVRFAIDAGYNPHAGGPFVFDNFDIIKFSRLLLQAEREECARVCGDLAELNRKAMTDSMWPQEECAAAIRARGKA